MIRKFTAPYRNESSTYARRGSVYAHRRSAMLRPTGKLAAAQLPIVVAKPVVVRDPLLDALPTMRLTPSIDKRVSARLPAENHHTAL